MTLASWTVGPKIALVDYTVNPSQPSRSGLSDIVWSLASSLADNGFQPHVFASYRGTAALDTRVTLHTIPSNPFTFRNVVGLTSTLLRAARAIKILRPALVHTPEYMSSAVLSWALPDVPIVLTTPGNIFQRLSVSMGHSYEWYYVQVLKWAARRTARHARRIIAVSEEMRVWWERTGAASSQVVVIPVGADPNLFFPAGGARKRLGLPPHQVMFLYVGRLAREKGIVDLISALNRLRTADSTKLNRLHVHLIGEGGLRSEIEGMIQRWQLGDTVHLHGWLAPEQLRDWYASADALVLPSYTEGMSRTIAEAMACGTPVIGTRISGTVDHVRPGVTGYLVGPRDIGGLAELLEALTANPAVLRNMRPAVREHAKDHLLWPSVVRRVILEAYWPIIQESSGVPTEAVPFTTSVRTPELD
jgi:glycosyltransferase involved in cell wall biosynthesis